MKLIDLLNDIANGNTLPDKILVFDDIFTLDKDAKDYKDAEGYYLFEDYSLIKFLNEEVKILEITVTMKQDTNTISELNDKIDKAIEYINTTDKWLCRVNENLCVEAIAKDKLLEILGEKENE